LLRTSPVLSLMGKRTWNLYCSLILRVRTKPRHTSNLGHPESFSRLSVWVEGQICLPEALAKTYADFLTAVTAKTSCRPEMLHSELGRKSTRPHHVAATRHRLTSKANMCFALAFCLVASLLAAIVSKGADRKETNGPWIATLSGSGIPNTLRTAMNGSARAPIRDSGLCLRRPQSQKSGGGLQRAPTYPSNVFHVEIAVEFTYVNKSGNVTHMVKMQVYLRKEELDALRMAAASSGRSIAELIRDAIRKVVLKPQAARPVAIWDGEPKRTSIEHDSVHDSR
jgi:hypothetical protein